MAAIDRLALTKDRSAGRFGTVRSGGRDLTGFKW